MDILTAEAQPSAEQMKHFMEQWMEWLEGISESGKLADGGNHLQYSGKVIRPGNVIDDKPYAAGGESVAGYIIINATDMDDAVRIAKKCPILNGGEKNSVEIRAIATPDAIDAIERS